MNFVLPDPNIFLWIAASVADAAVLNLNGIKTFLASGLSRYSSKVNRFFSNDPEMLPKNPSDCPILCN